ncbi:MAG: RNA 2'-phosphotransferase [Planctomycetes bacterium]|nr:RNA 2'-phosphotransferase [Planctomycetota bacterium]
MDRELISTSKFLSLVLRHHPEIIGISLDEQGWVEIDVLLAAANRSGRKLTRSLLDRVVRENDKQRFAISADGTKIRANQGHSIEVDLGLQPAQPPELLYHGTVARFLDAIRASGLQPGSRQYVHLSPDVETARKVGQRRGRPVILVVESGRMWQDGHAFYRAQNGVWLTDSVPAKYLQFDRCRAE